MADLKALASELGVADQVHFLGYTSDVAGIYEAGDVFALASRNESFGLVLAEAACFGLPVVATRAGGIPEVVSESETGLLVPPDDVPALSRALSALIADPSLRERLGAAGRLRVASQFTVQGMTSAMEECWRQLALGPPPRPLPLRLFSNLAPYARLLDGRRHIETPASR
jgi:glycosyltransferase involved in cell wall biosynthesis